MSYGNGPALAVSSQQYIPWPETVTITSVNANSSLNIVQTVNNAGVYQGDNREGAPSQGVYTKFGISVSLGSDSLSFTPKPGDTILWNGVTYTVQSVKSSFWMQVHQIQALDLILAFQLVQSGTLTRPTNAKDATGKLTDSVFTTIASNVPCRLQPIGGTATDLMQRRTMPQRFTVYLGYQLAPTPRAKDVFTVSGQPYTVLDYKNPQRIDELQTMTCELIDGTTTSQGTPTPSVQPAITGVPLVGNTLTASPGTWSLSPSFTYQWFSGGVAIAGATNPTYQLQNTDAGNIVSCTVTATSSNGTGQAAALVGPVVTAAGLTGTFD